MIVPFRILRDWGRVVLTRIVFIWLGAVTVFLCIDAFENLREYTAAGASTAEIVVYFASRIPEVAFQILPAAILLGTLVGLYGLAKHREMTAAEAAGLHPGWVYSVPLAIGVGFATLQIGLELSSLPQLRRVSDHIYATRIERNPLRLEAPVRWSVVGGDVWRLETVATGYRLERYRRSETTLSVLTVTDVVATPDGWQYGDAALVRYPNALTAQPVAEVEIPFLAEDLQPMRPSSRHEPLLTLWRKARDKYALTGQVNQRQLEFHQRLSWALMAVTVLFAILPWVPRHGRRASTAAGVLIALGIGLAGWAVIVFGTALATTEKQIIGFWLPHLFLVLTGLLGSTRIRTVFRAWRR